MKTAVVNYNEKSFQFVIQDDNEYIQKTLLASSKFYETDLLDSLAKLIKVGDGVALDIGANLGNHSIFFAGVLGLEVHAFEPLMQTYDLLQQNIRINEFNDKIFANNVAAGAENGWCEIDNVDQNNLGSTTVSQSQTGKIPLITIDSYVEKAKLSARIKLIKVDVEGFETQVIVGALDTIKRYHPILVIECVEYGLLRNILLLLGDEYLAFDLNCATPTYTLIYKDLLIGGDGVIFSDFWVPKLLHNRNFRTEYYKEQKKCDEMLEQKYSLLKEIKNSNTKLLDVLELNTQYLNKIDELNNSNLSLSDMKSNLLDKCDSLYETYVEYFNVAQESQMRIDELLVKLRNTEKELSDYKGSRAKYKRISSEYQWKYNQIINSRLFRLFSCISSPFKVISRIFSFKNKNNTPVVVSVADVMTKKSNNIVTENMKPLNTICRADVENIGKLQQFVSHSQNTPVTLIYADLTMNVVDGSSIWLTSVVNVFCSISNVIILSKENIKKDLIVSNFIDTSYSRLILEPKDFGIINDAINNEAASKILGFVDEFVPTVQNLLIRGTELAIELSKRNNFKDRILVYLTNFYKPTQNGPVVDELIKKQLSLINNQAKVWLFQTKEIQNLVEDLLGKKVLNYTVFPPVLSPDFTNYNYEYINQPSNNAIVIGYAGKIQPDWGVLELIEAAMSMNGMGFNIKLKIITSKISKGSNFNVNSSGFIDRIRELLKLDFIELVEGVNRSKVLELLKSVDFIWSFRPKYFEENTLEISTKLLEGVSLGIPTICYPNKINQDLLGKDYKYFIDNEHDLINIINLKPSKEFYTLANKIRSIFSFDARIELCQQFINKVHDESLLVAGEDLKFIEHFVSYLKSQGRPVYKDIWNWGSPGNESRSKRLYQLADIVFCEWGLANAVWYSQNNYLQKPIFIRIHAQEVRERARKFGSQINIENITKFIFVSEKIRDDAIRLWNWPIEKTIIIPNYVLGDDFILKQKIDLTPTIGLVGITPQSKRLDIAIDLISDLLEIYPNAKLYIKGKRPEEYEWMHAPGRIKELDYYYEQYKRLDNELLRNAVIFDGFANDMAEWYQKIDFILSTSDHESFHYGLADGVLSGCIPVIWPWEEADTIYSSDWIVKDVENAVEYIDQYLKKNIDEINQLRIQNRELIVSRYSSYNIYEALCSQIFLR